jgi:hypothetical protein
MSGAEVIALVGLGATIFGQVKAAEARSDAADLNSGLKEEQAKELLERSKINIARIERSGREVSGKQEAVVSSSGFELTGSTILLLEDTYRRISEKVADAGREARFKADQLRKGADIETELASDAFDAALIGAGGQLLIGGANFAAAQGGTKQKSEPLIRQQVTSAPAPVGFAFG